VSDGTLNLTQLSIKEHKCAMHILLHNFYAFYTSPVQNLHGFVCQNTLHFNKFRFSHYFTNSQLAHNAHITGVHSLFTHTFWNWLVLVLTLHWRWSQNFTYL